MNWRERYYERGYLKRWTLPPADEARSRAALGYLALAESPANARVLDLGCGHGAHALALAERGFDVVALDGSEALLNRAQAHASAYSQRVHWVQGDMSAIPFRRHFDVALMLSAFGYFETDRAGLQLLQGVAAVLQPEGRLVLHNPNAIRIRSDFKPWIRETRGGRTIDMYSRLDSLGQWLDQRVVIEDADGTEEFERRQRLYSADELELLLQDAGFVGMSHFSSSAGVAFDPHESTSLVTVCRTTSRSLPAGQARVTG